MKRALQVAAVAVLAAVVGGAAAQAVTADGGQLYATHCASCHGADRFGGTGPALLPESLERLRKPAAADAIANGRIATQMPAFGATLAKTDIDALVAYVYAPPAPAPTRSRRRAWFTLRKVRCPIGRVIGRIR